MENKKSNLLSRLAELLFGERRDELHRMRIYNSNLENFQIQAGTLYRLLRPRRFAEV